MIVSKPGTASRIARAIAALRTPALVVPGNHDATHPQQLLAEMARWGKVVKDYTIRPD